MAYLHTHNIIHRDLAARNILVHRYADGSIAAEVSDFGLCRSHEAGRGYCLRNSQKMPFKWMAPEMFKTYVWPTASDVWSFGILMWEIFSNGLYPYSTTQSLPSGAISLSKYISEGNHPERPEYVCDDIWNVMCSCWIVDIHKRPTMTELVVTLEKLYKKNEQILKTIHEILFCFYCVLLFTINSFELYVRLRSFFKIN